MSPTPEDDFRTLVLKYIEVCDRMDQMAVLRKAKNELQKNIMAYMKANDVSQCNLRDGGSLVLKQTKTAAPVNKDYIAEQLATRLPPDEAHRIVAHMWANRNVQTKDALKRIKDA